MNTRTQDIDQHAKTHHAGTITLGIMAQAGEEITHESKINTGAHKTNIPRRTIKNGGGAVPQNIQHIRTKHPSQTTGNTGVENRHRSKQQQAHNMI